MGDALGKKKRRCRRYTLAWVIPAVMKHNHWTLNSHSCLITFAVLLFLLRFVRVLTMSIVSPLQSGGRALMRKAGVNRGNSQYVCEGGREGGKVGGRRGKENPGGINSSYRNSSGLVSASVLG